MGSTARIAVLAIAADYAERFGSLRELAPVDMRRPSRLARPPVRRHAHAWAIIVVLLVLWLLGFARTWGGGLIRPLRLAIANYRKVKAPLRKWEAEPSALSTLNTLARNDQGSRANSMQMRMC